MSSSTLNGIEPSDLPLLEVAARVGFSEVSTFHRGFKSWTVLTPGAYLHGHNEPVEHVAAG